MAISDLQHSELPDNLLHEPKGASTAVEGTTYIADGAGSGAFKKVPVNSLDISVPSVTESSTTVIPSTDSLFGTNLAQVANGALTDVEAFVGIPQEITNMINKNASELLRVYKNQKAINTQVSTNLSSIEAKLNEVITALKGIGLFND